MTNYTNLHLQSFEEQVILKDKFFSQSVPDARWKLQKLGRDLGTTPGEVLLAATAVFYNWDQEERQDTRQAQLLVAS